MTHQPVQLKFPFAAEEAENKKPLLELSPDKQANRLDEKDRAIHDWYRFVLSFPPHLVQEYFKRFDIKTGDIVLDPFCGTGTTLVEAKLSGLRSLGVEANPFAFFASSVKVDWEIDPEELLCHAGEIVSYAQERLTKQGISDDQIFKFLHENSKLLTLNAEAESLLISGSISPLPLHKTLVLLEAIQKYQDWHGYRHLLLALGNTLVHQISNLHFGPEVGVGKPKEDTPVLAPWLAAVYKMAEDLRAISAKSDVSSQVFLADSREINKFIPPATVDAVITSPPYPNEKDYTRTTRLESVILGFIQNKAELRQYKQGLVRSNTRTVYKNDEDDVWVSKNPMIQQIAEEIENKRIELGKNSGFERQYSRVTRLYFGGMARHLDGLREVLKPGALLAYVVGDQASYLRVMIRTGELLAQIAQEMGYELVQIDLFRMRFATASQEWLKEEVVILKWPGK
jgi:DNA modification methylase